MIWMRETTKKFGSTLVLTLLLTVASSSQIKITVDHNSGSNATPAFRFQHVPSPVKDDAGAKAKVSLLVGQSDPAGTGLRALTDGLLPGSEDDPANNFFFNADTDGGRVLMDLGTAIEVAQINTYSWHVDS